MEVKKKSDRVYRIHMVVDGAVLPADTKPEDFATMYVKGKKQRVLLVPSTEEVYKAYLNQTEAARKKIHRHSEENITNEAQALPVSLDQLLSEDGFDLEDPIDHLGFETLAWLIKEAIEDIRKTHPNYAQYLELFSQDYSEREIAKIMHRSRGTIRDFKSYAFPLLKELLEKKL